MALQEFKASLTAHQTQKLADSDKLPEGLTAGEAVEITFQYDLGGGDGVSHEDQVAAFIERFGHKCASEMIYGHAMFRLQGKARSLAAAGKSSEEIQAALWDLENDEPVYNIAATRKRGKSEVEKFKDSYAGMSEEERAKVLEELKGL